MASTSSQLTSWGKALAACIIVGLSLVVSAASFTGFVYYEMLIGNLPFTYGSNLKGELKDGELWFGVLKTTGNPFVPNYEYRISCLNLRTGQFRDANLPPFREKPIPIWIGETLYIRTYNEIFQAIDQSFIRLPPIQSIGRTAFEFEGHLTVVIQTVDEQFQLQHWIGGKWTPGRCILLPDPDQVWYFDGQRDRMKFQPRDPDRQSYETWKLGGQLVVAHQGDQYHLMVQSSTCDFTAYRLGFEFADEALEGVSALAPKNVPHEFASWERISLNQKHDYWSQMACDREGPLIGSTHPGPRVARRIPDGRWDELAIEGLQNWQTNGFPSIVASASESAAYLVLWDRQWSSARICQIDSQNGHSADIIVPGFKKAYVQRGARIFAELLCVWMVHIFIVCFVTRLILRRTTTHQYDSGHRRATLASVGQRTIAMLIDLALGYGLIWTAFFSWRHYFFSATSVWPVPSFDDLAISLQNLEQMLEFNNGDVSGRTQAVRIR